MPTVTMPQLGESVTEGTILQWLKQPGDAVALDEPICEIETEKVTAELPSPYEGTMGEILVPEGETVEVGTALCVVGAAGEQPVATTTPAKARFEGDMVDSAAAPVVAAVEEAFQPPPVTPARWSGGPMAIPPDEDSAAPPSPPKHAAAAPASNGHAPSSKPDERQRFYSPAVLRIAREHNLDLSQVTGTGADGRVTRKDVEGFIARPQAAGRSPAAQRDPGTTAGAVYEVVPLSATRRTIAENMKRSNLEAPQAWTMVEADVTDLMALRARERERFQRQEGVDLTLLPYFTVAVAEALREHPALNARWEGDELRRYHSLNLGIAIATETGLVVPNIHNAQDLSVTGVAKAIADLVDRAQNRKLRLEDIQEGTFTVNNTGSFGSIASKPIVNYPQVAIVTMERAVKRPVVVEGDAIAIRWMVNLCLSFDHRAMDGLEAGQFLATLKKKVEAFGD